MGHVLNEKGGEIRLAGFRAKAGEFRDFDANGIIPFRVGVVKRLQIFAGLTIFTKLTRHRFSLVLLFAANLNGGVV